VIILHLTKTILILEISFEWMRLSSYNILSFVCFHFSFMVVCHCCMCSMGLYGSLYLPANGEIYLGYRYIDICSHLSCVKQFDISTINYAILLIFTFCAILGAVFLPGAVRGTLAWPWIMWSGLWPGTLCCVLGQDTLLSQWLPPSRCISGYWWLLGATWQNAWN